MSAYHNIFGGFYLAAFLAFTLPVTVLAGAEGLKIADQLEQSKRVNTLRLVSENHRGEGFIDAHRRFRIEMNPITHLPDYIAGTIPTDSKSNRPEQVGAAFLAANGDLMGLNHPNLTTEVVNFRTEPSGLGHARFQVKLDGIPIEGAQILISSEDKAIRTVVATLIPPSETQADIRISGRDAQKLAKNHLHGALEADQSDDKRYRRLENTGHRELVWFNPDLLMEEAGPTLLCWRVEVAHWIYYIHATTGEIVSQYDGMQSALNRRTHTTHNTNNLPGTLVIDESTQDPAAITEDMDILLAHDYTAFVYDYYAEHHGRDSWDGQGGALVSTVHYGEDIHNAYWDGTQIIYGDGDFMVQEDICAHEITHGVIDSTAGLVYLHQPGAVNEAIADAFAYLATGDSEIGEGLDAGALRDIADPDAYGLPDHMDEYRYLPVSIDNGGVHHYSGIVSQAVYLLAEGGVKSDIHVPAQGLTITESIWYKALTHYMTPVTGFAGARYAVEAACADLMGSESPSCEAVALSFAAQGII